MAVEYDIDPILSDPAVLHNPTESHIIPQQLWDGVWGAFPSAMLRIHSKEGGRTWDDR